MDRRPHLNKRISIVDFNDFYWLKEELVEFCRSENLNTSGSKIEITKRIRQYIQTGIKPKVVKKLKPKSTFNWNLEILTLDTVITDNYKNSENVRLFFIKNIGDKFKFNVKFMNWMKSNTGQTLENAIVQYEQLLIDKKLNSTKKKIAPQFEYNKYLRDFLADNPNFDRDLGIRLWKIKKSMRGNNVYSREDLKLVE